MGVDTKLYISHRFNLEDIMDVIEYHVMPDVFGIEGKAKFNVGSDGQSGFIVFGAEERKDMRSMFYYPQAKTPLGPTKLLSLGHNEQAIKIMTCIAEVLGGLVQEADYSEDMKMYDGKLTEEDGLSYFLKYAVIHNEIKGKNEEVEELKASIQKWNEKYRSQNKGWR